MSESSMYSTSTTMDDPPKTKSQDTTASHDTGDTGDTETTYHSTKSTLTDEGEEGCAASGTKFMSYRTISPEPICQRAWVMDSTRGLHLVEDAPMPDVGEDDVLVRIRAVALCHEDLYMDPSVDSLIPATDAAGEVVRGKDWEHGEPVILPPQKGMLREYVAIPAKQLVHTRLDFDSAAAVPTPGSIALAALAGLKANDWVLAGSGDVGVQALLFAKAAGAHVVTTTSKLTKSHHLRALGSDFVVNTRESPQWGDVARGLTPNGRGFDYVLASGWRYEQGCGAVRAGGVLCAIGSGDRAGERLVNGVSIRVMPIKFGSGDIDVLEAAARMAEIAPPDVDRVFSFENVPLAYAFLSGRRVGRVVVRV